MYFVLLYLEHMVVQLVEALRYTPEGQGFDSRCHWNFLLPQSWLHCGPKVDSL
jgi:hypothetical protein